MCSFSSAIHICTFLEEIIIKPQYIKLVVPLNFFSILLFIFCMFHLFNAPDSDHQLNVHTKCPGLKMPV